MTAASFPVLEVIGAIGGLIFFIFLVVAICSKSSKNWDQVLEKQEIDRTDPGNDTSFVMEMSFHERERVKKVQEENRRRKTILMHQKKQRMQSIMHQKDITESYFKKKQDRTKSIRVQSFFDRSHKRREYAQSKFTTSESITEPKKKVSTKQRMRQLMKQRMAKAFSSKISENTQENQLESVDNYDMIKVPHHQQNYRLSKSLKRYHLQPQKQV